MGKTKNKTKARSVGDSPKPSITIRSTNPKVIDDNIAKLEKAIKGVDEASEISYDNTGSGLTAENVQSALDEIVEGLTAPAASDVTYDNTDSGLTADDVQSAIDEIDTSFDTLLNNIGNFKVLLREVTNTALELAVDMDYHTYLIISYGGGTNWQIAFAGFRSNNDGNISNIVGSGVTLSEGKLHFGFTNYHISTVIQLS